MARRGDLKENAIQEHGTLSLFYAQRHQDQSKQEEKVDEGLNTTSWKEKEIPYL
jgi:hypothetical protein